MQRTILIVCLLIVPFGCSSAIIGSGDTFFQEDLDKTTIAAEEGEPRAEFQIANDYFLRGDYPHAEKWFEKAANAGMIGAQLDLCSLTFPDEQRDLLEAWLRSYWLKGNGLAGYNFQSAYQKRLVDDIHAYMWCRIVELKGTMGAEDARNSEEFLHIYMSQNDIAEAEKLAGDWVKQHSKLQRR